MFDIEYLTLDIGFKPDGNMGIGYLTLDIGLVLTELKTRTRISQKSNVKSPMYNLQYPISTVQSPKSNIRL